MTERIKAILDTVTDRVLAYAKVTKGQRRGSDLPLFAWRSAP